MGDQGTAGEPRRGYGTDHIDKRGNGADEASPEAAEPCLDCSHPQSQHDYSGDGCHPCLVDGCGCGCWFPTFD